MRLHTHTLEMVKALERGYTHTLGMVNEGYTHTHARDGEDLGMRLHTHTHKRWRRPGNEATHTHAIDGEGLGMRLHTHTLVMVKAWERGYTHMLEMVNEATHTQMLEMVKA